MSLIKQEPENL